MVDSVGEHLFDFREEFVFNPVEVKALQLYHTIAVAACKFLDPVAHRLLAVLDLVVQGLLDEGPLDFHVALHVERHAVGSDKLLQQNQ